MQQARTPPTRPALPSPLPDPPARHSGTDSPPRAAAIDAWFDLDELAAGGRPDNAPMALAHILPTTAAQPARTRVRARRQRDLAPAIGLLWSAGLGGALWALLLAALRLV
ncbi:MAG: hypothetical protein MUD07_02625 [Burkholderiaceae bacterium]|nr:hypothetical protein [Burkholderiaceae bacterium]